MIGPTPLSGFTGRARLFPLPNLVFFPQVMQPLHIFEPRYRQMTADALAGDRLIALVLPLPGWEKDYADRPGLHSVACLGEIVAEQRLDDGRFNILLRGLARIRIVGEMLTDRLYRVARSEIVTEVPLVEEPCAAGWRRTLHKKIPCWFANQGEIIEQLRKLLQTDLALGTLCDIMTFALPLEPEFKQRLLEEPDVETRLRKLRGFLDSAQAGGQNAQRSFPPEFSVN